MIKHTSTIPTLSRLVGLTSNSETILYTKKNSGVPTGIRSYSIMPHRFTYLSTRNYNCLLIVVGILLRCPQKQTNAKPSINHEGTVPTLSRLLVSESGYFWRQMISPERLILAHIFGAANKKLKSYVSSLVEARAARFRTRNRFKTHSFYSIENIIGGMCGRY